MKILFEENQRFNQWWIWTILIIVTIAPLILLYYELDADTGMPHIKTISAGSLSTLITLLLTVVLFLVLKLRTTITNNAISLVYFPFVRKTITASETADMAVINYGFVGGWGIRWFTKYGTVYNVRGNMGLYIKMKNGKELVIGTQKPEEGQLNSS